MGFLCGFLCCWILLGLFAWIGMARDWFERAGFWMVLCLPVLPAAWVAIRLEEAFGGEG